MSFIEIDGHLLAADQIEYVSPPYQTGQRKYDTHFYVSMKSGKTIHIDDFRGFELNKVKEFLAIKKLNH